MATVQSARGLAELDIPLSDGRRIRLADVATVDDTVAVPGSLNSRSTASWLLPEKKPDVWSKRGTSVSIAATVMGNPSYSIS